MIIQTKYLSMPKLIKNHAEVKVIGSVYQTQMLKLVIEHRYREKTASRKLIFLDDEVIQRLSYYSVL